MDWLFLDVTEGVIRATLLVEEHVVQHTIQLLQTRLLGSVDHGRVRRRKGVHIEIGLRQWHTYGFYYPSDGLAWSNQRETAAVLRSLLYYKPLLQ
jgi:hypothetical protein